MIITISITDFHQIANGFNIKIKKGIKISQSAIMNIPPFHLAVNIFGESLGTPIFIVMPTKFAHMTSKEILATPNLNKYIYVSAGMPVPYNLTKAQAPHTPNGYKALIYSTLEYQLKRIQNNVKNLKS